MEIGTSFVAGTEAFELVQPGEGALGDPAHLAQSGAVGDAASGDQRFDTALPQHAAVLVEVVAPVGIQAPGLTAGTSPQAPDRRDGVEQGQELGDVVPVPAGERDGERGSWRSTIRWCRQRTGDERDPLRQEPHPAATDPPVDTHLRGLRRQQHRPASSTKAAAACSWWPSSPNAGAHDTIAREKSSGPSRLSPRAAGRPPDERNTARTAKAGGRRVRQGGGQAAGRGILPPPSSADRREPCFRRLARCPAPRPCRPRSPC